MTKSKKNKFHRFLPLLGLIVVLLLSVALVLLLPAIQKAFPPAHTAAVPLENTDSLIAQEDADTLDTITVSHANGDRYTLVNQSNMLALRKENGETELINETYTEALIKYATQIYILETIADDETDYLDTLSDMGFNPPQIKVVTTFTSGKTITIELGNSLNSTSEYYYRWSGDNAIYLCSASVYQTFNYTGNMLLNIDQPSIIPSLVERIRILPREKDAIVCSFETSENNTIHGSLQSPFLYPMQQETAEAMLTAAKNLRLGMRIGPVTDETRSQYGFDSPQTVIEISQREGLFSLTDSDGALQTYTVPASTTTFIIGDQEDDFSYYCEVDSVCYRVSYFLIVSFLNADAVKYISLNPANMGDDSLQSITLQTGSGTLDIRVSYQENVLPNNELETDESGNIVYTKTVTANNEIITNERFDAFVMRLRQMAVSGRFTNISVPNGIPKWQMTLTTVQGKNRTLAAYTLDAFNDIISVDGVALHYINNEALEIALGDLSALLTNPLAP